MTHHDYSYIIIPTVELTDAMVSLSSDTLESMRHSSDKTKIMIRFPTLHPEVMSGYLKYSLSEITDLMEGEAWQAESVLGEEEHHEE